MNNVWHFKRTTQVERQYAGNHATPKPVELCKRAILSSSKESMCVLDLFGGSGSTLIASEKLKRISRLMELDPYNCDIIVNRYIAWCKNNNKTPIIKRNGKKFKREK
jgi:DNA modification methylase